MDFVYLSFYETVMCMSILFFFFFSVFTMVQEITDGPNEDILY